MYQKLRQRLRASRRADSELPDAAVVEAGAVFGKNEGHFALAAPSYSIHFADSAVSGFDCGTGLLRSCCAGCGGRGWWRRDGIVALEACERGVILVSTLSPERKVKGWDGMPGESARVQNSGSSTHPSLRSGFAQDDKSEKQPQVLRPLRMTKQGDDRRLFTPLRMTNPIWNLP